MIERSEEEKRIPLTLRDIDEWVRIELWQRMGVTPSYPEYSALIRACKALFGTGPTLEEETKKEK